MTRLKVYVLCAVLLIAACSRIDVAGIFEGYLWEKPVLLVFAPSHASDALQTQLAILDKGHTSLRERKFALWVLVHNRLVMVDGEAKPHLFTRPFYAHFGVEEERFTVIVLGRDGEEKLRTHDVVPLETLLAAPR